MAWLLFAYFAFINVITFGTFALDKNAAANGERRISENTLLLQALIGGSVGAVAAQRFLRHKTQKEPFRTMLYAIVVLQLGALVYLQLNGTPRAIIEFTNDFVNR